MTKEQSCQNCKYNNCCSLKKQIEQANGLNEDVDFICKDWEEE